MSDDNWVSKTIVPKSDQLNAESLLTGSITVTVKDVKQGDKDQPVAIVIDGGHQPYKPCKTMRRVLVSCWGDIAANWVGKSMTLFCDPEVKWAGEPVGGIRISHLSHIDGARKLSLSETRGKRRAFTVLPLQTSKAPPAKSDDPVLARHRDLFKGAPKPVASLSLKIANAYKQKDSEAMSAIEPEIAQQSEEWSSKLKAFMTDALEALAS